MTNATLTRKELQTALRNLKDIGQTVIKLNTTTENLQKEYDQLNAPKTIKIMTGKLCNGTYGVWVDGKYDYLTERQLIQLGCKHLIEAQNKVVNDVKTQLKSILNNPEMMSKLNAIENIENIDNILELRPKKTMSWATWLNHAIVSYTAVQLIESKETINKAYQLAK
jgi:hypothetical protein